MSIHIDFIPQAEQRYDTIGDWYWDDYGNLQIRVTSDDPEYNHDQQILVAIHELIEVLGCHKAGITQEQVDAFDMGPGAYDRIPEGEESGDQPGAPYRRQHRFACLIEYLIAHEWGLDGYGKMK